MNTDGEKSSAAREAFENYLKSEGWTDELLHDGFWQTLPQTTLVADRTDIQAVLDVSKAEAAAKRVEPAFKVTRVVVSRFTRVDSRTDKRRRKESMAKELRRLIVKDE